MKRSLASLIPSLGPLGAINQVGFADHVPTIGDHGQKLTFPHTSHLPRSTCNETPFSRDANGSNTDTWWSSSLVSKWNGTFGFRETGPLVVVVQSGPKLVVIIGSL
jgi:hypothetical protein